MTYDEAVTALYQAPVATFVAERKRLAGALREAGDKAGAAKLGKLARPTLSAWVVNQLYWHARDAFGAMFETANRLRAGDLGASAAHREAIANLRGRAARLLTDAGHGAPEATLRRVTTTLSALAAAGGFDPDPPGALADDREPVGFDVAVALANVPARAAPPPAKPAPVDSAGAQSIESPGSAGTRSVAQRRGESIEAPPVEPPTDAELAPEAEAERRAELQRQLDDEARARDKRKAHAEAAVARRREVANDGAAAKPRADAETKRGADTNEATRAADTNEATRATDADAKRVADEAEAKRRAEAEAKRRVEAEAADAKRRADEARAKKAAERSRLVAGLATARAELANRERAVTALSEQLETAELKVAEVRELIAMFEAKLREHDAG